MMAFQNNKVVRPFGTGQITIPAEFRRRLNIGRDTLLNMVLREGRIEISPLKVEASEQNLREYSRAEIDQFVADDKLDPRTAAKVRKLLS